MRGSPSHVIIILAYHPRTKEEYLSLYAANASNNSTNKSRNHLFGYLCYLGDEEEVSFHMVTTNFLVTSFAKLTGSNPRLQRIACMRHRLGQITHRRTGSCHQKVIVHPLFILYMGNGVARPPQLAFHSVHARDA